MKKFKVFKYSDGTIIHEEHDELYDGPWRYGETTEKVFNFDYPFYNK